MPPRPSRRTFMLAAVALPGAAVAGCTLSGRTPRSSTGPSRRSDDVDPDVALLVEAAATTQAMVTLYERTLRRHRDLRRDLRPLLAAHRAHATALGEAAPPTATTGRQGGTPSTTSPEVPPRPAAAARVLQDAERSAAEELLGFTRRAASGAFARLLASMAAASAQQARVLEEMSSR